MEGGCASHTIVHVHGSLVHVHVHHVVIYMCQTCLTFRSLEMALGRATGEDLKLGGVVGFCADVIQGTPLHTSSPYSILTPS